MTLVTDNAGFPDWLRFVSEAVIVVFAPLLIWISKVILRIDQRQREGIARLSQTMYGLPEQPGGIVADVTMLRERYHKQQSQITGAETRISVIEHHTGLAGHEG